MQTRIHKRRSGTFCVTTRHLGQSVFRTIECSIHRTTRQLHFMMAKAQARNEVDVVNLVAAKAQARFQAAH